LNKEKNWFASFLKNPTDESLEELFHDVEANTIFYGHNHTSSHHHNDRQFINLGSAGCWDKPVVRLGILEPNSKSFFLKKLYVPYEDDGLMEDYEKRHVPAREFITNTFLTR